MPAVVRLRRLMFVMPSQEAGISVTPPKPMTSNSKSEGRFGKQDFVYVGADDIYLCPAGERLSYRYTNEEDGKTLRRYWTTACQACTVKSKCTTGKKSAWAGSANGRAKNSRRRSTGTWSS